MIAYLLLQVWATGSKWHYAPMAHALARLGIVAVVMQYTLYPDALVPQLVDEVSQALNWVLNNARQYGGDPSKVTRTLEYEQPVLSGLLTSRRCRFCSGILSMLACSHGILFRSTTLQAECTAPPSMAYFSVSCCV